MGPGRSNSSKDESPKVKISKENLRQALILFTYLKPYRGKFILSLVFIGSSPLTLSLSSRSQKNFFLHGYQNLDFIQTNPKECFNYVLTREIKSLYPKHYE